MAVKYIYATVSFVIWIVRCYIIQYHETETSQVLTTMLYNSKTNSRYHFRGHHIFRMLKSSYLRRFCHAVFIVVAAAAAAIRFTTFD